MATAWYKPHAVPKLVHAFQSRTACIQVWTTTCIVRNFGKAHGFKLLINPSNPSLLGVHKFPYFPQGGPEPTSSPNKDPHHIMGYVTQWGGMELQHGMLFAGNVVDGLVHELGGWPLRAQCYRLPGGGERCPVGHAVTTPTTLLGMMTQLSRHYERIVHTVPPFYEHHEHPRDALRQCYRNALELAFAYENGVTCPLLGAGARGFPQREAIQIAAQESVLWRDTTSATQNNERQQVLVFGIPEMSVAEALVEAITRAEEEARGGDDDERIKRPA